MLMPMFQLSKAICVLFFLSSMSGAFLLPAQELQKIGYLPYAPLSLSGCWHHIDSSGGEWALVGTSAGLSIVDVRQPTQPRERFFVPGKTNNYREVRTWAGFAYVGSEATGSGITIVDLRELPDTIRWKVWVGDGVYDSLVVHSHTVQAVDGYLYIFGGGVVTNGATIADLSDPWNPVIVGKYTNNYVHDGYIRGDTLWTSEITKGWFGVVDVSDRSNPTLLATQPTPGAFCHNSGLSDDSRVLFTTDEKPSAPLGAFDVSNLDDIKMLDAYWPSRKPAGEVHNVRVFGQFLVNACYKGQLTLVDASRPGNLIETAWDSLGNALVWDVDPYLPSGIILATAKLEGFYVYQKPAYRHAAWLEGTVTDGISGHPLSNTKVFIRGTLNADTSFVNGQYKTGAAEPGRYEVFAMRKGYLPATFKDVELISNQLTTLDIELFPELSPQNPAEDNLWRIAPTPFDGYIRVDFPEGSPYRKSETMLRVFDTGGKLLLEKTADGNGTTLLKNLEQLPKGGYVLLATNKLSGNYNSARIMK